MADSDTALTGGEKRECVWDGPRLAAVHDQIDKSIRVRRMFDAIASRYELVNTIFSVGRDRAWRKRAVRLARVHDGDAILDVACGTGNLLRSFHRWAGRAGRFCGADFSPRMLAEAVKGSSSDLNWCGSDGLCLPFADESFDVVGCAFGVRNFQNLQCGLVEMHRVLRRGGHAVILEFSRPPNAVVRAVHEFYCGRIMPLGATWLSGDRTGAYRYLPQSVTTFVGPEEMARQLGGAGFASVQAHPMTLGIVTIYVATKGPK